jgi:predicted aspartyl protease
MPKGIMRGSLLGMSYLAKLKSFKVEDGVLYLKN